MKFSNLSILSGLLANHALAADCSTATIRDLINGNEDGTANPDAIAQLGVCMETPPAGEYDTLGETFAGDQALPHPGPRYFIISIGPPSSGKGTALKRMIFPRLGIPVVGDTRPDGTTVTAEDVSAVLYHRDIDKVIMDRPEWQDHLNTGQQADMLRFSERYANASPERRKKMRQWVKVYESFEDKSGLPKPATVAATENYNNLWTHANAAEVGHSTIFWMYTNDIYKQAPSKHILFEATGCSDYFSPTMFRLAASAARHGYIPIVVYPIVHKHQLYGRWANRAGQEGRAPVYSAKDANKYKSYLDPAVAAVPKMSCAVNAFRNAMRVSHAISNYDECPIRALFVLDNTDDNVVMLNEVISAPFQGNI